MAKMKQTSKLKFKTLLLSILMLLISCVYIFSACNTTNTNNDEDEEETAKTDTQTFANADFEYFDDNNESYLIYTPNNWSKSSGSNALGDTASSSLAKSGIVDTSKDWGKDFLAAKDNYDTYKNTASDDIPEDVDYYTDIDNDYDIPGWDVANDAKTGDTLEDTAIKDAADAANPKTHWANDSDASDKNEKNGTHVLMLHNYRSDRNARGTAAKYTSSSITVPANTAVKVSVWVKTHGLTDYKGNPVKAGDPRGAYISINNTVGGSSQDALFVNNIVTDTWTQYTFFVKASTYATTNFSLVLGLGQGGGDTKLEYVDGYAFFDDVQYEVMTANEYDTATNTIEDKYTYSLNFDIANDLNKKDAYADTRAEKVYALDLSKSFTSIAPTITSADLTKDDYGQTITDDNSKKLLVNTSDVKGSYLTASSLASSTTTDIKDAFKNYPWQDSDNVLLIASYGGANYTAKLDNGWTVNSEDYLAISFWVKTSELEGGTGATITLRDKANASTIGAVDTTTLTAIDIKDDNGTREDIFDGWQQCFLFVENQTKGALSFTIDLSYGPTTNSGTAITSYKEGFAAFRGFSQVAMSEQEFALKSTGTYAVSVSLVGDYKSATRSGGFDDVAFAPTDKIETGFADTKAYDGIWGGSVYVGGENTTNTAKNANTENAGLLNRAYADTYYNNIAQIKSFADAANSGVSATTWWDEVLGAETNQPLFITNGSTDASYGYVAKNASTLSTSSYTTISYKVMVTPGAVANLYLIDTTAPEEIGGVRYADSLNLKTNLSYRYDSNNNLVSKDPNSNDFDATKDTLLYYQENGLWAKTKNYSGSELFANLANYQTDKDGNLTDANDNIVYYLNGETYYRYYNESTNKYSVAVKDFKDALTTEQLASATFEQSASVKAQATITGTSENAYKWIYVNFYIANGDQAKNYRLEVWSGSRDAATKMTANSVVVFDKVSPNALTAENYSAILAENLLDAYDMTLEEVIEAYNDGTLPTNVAEIVLTHYSVFDDADYKSYDADYDTDGEGNIYAEYDGSAYKDTVAYFIYKTTNKHNTFLDYSAVEKTVSASSSDTEEDEESTTSGSEQNIWLLISSIILAVVLVLTLIVMLVRKLVEHIKKGKTVKTNNTYSNKRTRYMRKLKLAESTDYEDDADDVLPEDEEISEEEIYQVEETGEEISEDEKSDNE